MTTLADYPQLITIVILMPVLLGFWLVRRNIDAPGVEAGEFTARVGARVGWARASWPLASLTVSKTALRLSALGTYVFAPTEVVGLERVGIPFISSGVRIVHSRAEYPENIVVWSLGSPDQLIARISEAGFHGTAPVTSAAGAKGFPLRWSAVVVFIIVWNVLLFIDFDRGNGNGREPGILTLVAFAMVFVLAWGLRVSEWVQGMVLRQGHSIGEIQTPLLIAQLVAGAFLVGFALVHAFRITV